MSPGHDEGTETHLEYSNLLMIYKLHEMANSFESESWNYTNSVNTLHCTVENLPPNKRNDVNYIHCIIFAMGVQCETTYLWWLGTTFCQLPWCPGCVAFRSHDDELELSFLKHWIEEANHHRGIKNHFQSKKFYIPCPFWNSWIRYLTISLSLYQQSSQATVRI